eukprot:s6411_g1.t1
MRGRCKLESSHRAPRAHGRQTRAWNSAGEEPPGLFEELPPEDTEHPCWTGNWAIPAAQQGVVVLGSPMGSREFIATKLAQRLKKPGPSPESDAACAQPAVGVMDFAVYCAAPRSTYLLRTLSPTDTADFAASHDAAIQHSLAQMLAGGDGDKPLPELSHRRAQPPRAWEVWDWRLPVSNATLPTGAPGRTRPERCGNSNPAPTWAKMEEDAAAPADHTTRPAPGERSGWQRTASKALHKRARDAFH